MFTNILNEEILTIFQFSGTLTLHLSDFYVDTVPVFFSFLAMSYYVFFPPNLDLGTKLQIFRQIFAIAHKPPWSSFYWRCV